MKVFLYLIFFTIPSIVFATNYYSLDEVTQNNTPDNCYMIFENKVYDISEDRLKTHDKFMDIRDWCGKDMTIDFKTKAGLGRDHKESSYSLLENYYIGDLIVKDEPVLKTEALDSVEESTVSQTPKTSNPYNFWIPFLGVIVAYVLFWTGTKIKVSDQKFLIPKNIFNTIFNSLLILGLLPSLGFGTLMTLQYQYPSLRDFTDSLYFWHVHGSIVFGTTAGMHFLTRFTSFVIQLKNSIIKKRNLVENEI